MQVRAPEVQVGRQVVRAHCINSGRMEGMVVPGARVWLSRALACLGHH